MHLMHNVLVVESGVSHICVVLVSKPGALECFGSNEYGQSHVPLFNTHDLEDNTVY